MKKILFTLFILIFCSFPAFSLTIDEAREVAFENTEEQLLISLFSDFMFDMYSSTHVRDAMRGYTEFNDITPSGNVRGHIKLVFFLDNVDYYIIWYDNLPDFEFSYSTHGDLKQIVYENSENYKYPRKKIKYNAEGKLIQVLVYMQDGEQFIFSEKKKLLTHWVNNKPYNEKGRRLLMVFYEF